MKKSRTYRVAACIVVWILFLGAGIPSAGAQDVDTETLAKVDAFIADKMQELKIPGLALGIVDGDRIVYLKGYGVADPTGREVTPQTPFLLASLSKSFTALAIMQLVEAGKIDLDAPVQEYISWFRPADTERPIKVSDLLYHTSGFSLYTGRENLFDSDTSDSALESNVRRLSAAELDRPVSESFEYTNAGYDIAGYLVQVVSGQSYESYMQEHILVPLDMQHSFLSSDEASADGKAIGYYPFFGIQIAYDTRYSRSSVPSTGILSSAEDMAHYLIAHLNEGRYGDTSVLSPEGMAKLHEPGVQIYPCCGYAMGWNVWPIWDAIVRDPDGLGFRIPSMLQHEGDGVTFRTNMILVPEDRWGVITLMNAGDPAIQSVFNSVGFGVADLLLGVEPQPFNIVEDFFTRNGRLIGVGIVLLQIMWLIWSLRNIRRWRRDPESRPRSLLQVARDVVLPAVIDIGLAAWILVGVPRQEQVPLPVLMRSVPDIDLLAIVVLVLALGWGTVRTILYLMALRGGVSRTVPAVSAEA